MPNLIPTGSVADRIHYIRGLKVMVDDDLARVYGVTTKRLNQQVHRNKERFPRDFMFQLTHEETNSLRLQSATFKITGRGQYRKYRPYVFTEHGAVMVSAVLRTSTAIEASIQIARAFVQLRQILAGNVALAGKLKELESKLTVHDHQIVAIFQAIRELIAYSGPFRTSIRDSERDSGAFRTRLP